MWPFNKKQLSIDALEPENDRWTVFEKTTPDGPMLVRLNTSAKQWIGHPTLPIRLGFALPLNRPYPGGLIDGEENRVLSEVEDIIVAHVTASGPAIEVLAITTGTYKEFMFHIGNGEAIAGIHQALQAEITSHEVQCVGIHDPEWETYRSFRVG